MEGKRRYFTQMRKRLLKCRKRLDTLKKQGYQFSNDIYYDLESIEKKIVRPSLFQQAMSKRQSIPIMGVFLIILIYVLFTPPIQDLPIITITVTNLSEDQIINTSYVINGTANTSFGKISVIQVNIDGENETTWENATILKEQNGTYHWSYLLDLTDLRDGNHVLFFRCCVGKASNILHMGVIKKYTAPTVSIRNLNNGDIVIDSFNISGFADSEHGEIKQVAIRFNETGEWITVNGTTDWYYCWNATGVKTESCIVYVKSIDTNNISSEEYRVLIEVRHRIIRNLSTGGLFSLYIFTDYPLMKPTGAYNIEISHFKQAQNVIFENINSVKTYLTVMGDVPDYLHIELPEEPIITPPNGIQYTIPVNVTISQNATKNEECMVTISYIYGIAPFVDPLINHPKLQELIPINGKVIGRGTQDIQFRTGTW